MEARLWKNKVNRCLKQVNIDPKQYASVIQTLADILEQRDICFEQYLEDGDKPVIEYTNKIGATNTVKNPKLVMWMDLNTQALAYWRELGLTPHRCAVQSLTLLVAQCPLYDINYKLRSFWSDLIFRIFQVSEKPFDTLFSFDVRIDPA